jgi:surface antigen
MRAATLNGAKTTWPGLPNGRGWLLGLTLALAPGLAAAPSLAATTQTQQTPAQSSHRPQATAAHGQSATTHATARTATPPGKRGSQVAKNGKARVARGGGLQCVPFARNASGIEVAGNAHLWWDHAAGVYARGQTPEANSILSFRANRSMPLGHVAVVRRVVNARELEIDHANWSGPGGRKGSVSRGVSVVDVSDNNDWTAVRVALGHSGDYGSIYPTNGFIYERPETGGTMMAANTAAPTATPAPIPELNSAPRDLRPAGAQTNGYASVSYAGGNYEEVAEAPASPRRSATRRKRSQAQH